MGQVQEMQGGFGVYSKHAIIGGIIGGVASAIPFLNFLNMCFCLLIQAGAALGMSMFFSENPGAGMRDGNAAMFGGVSGVVAGVVSGLLSVSLSFVWVGFASPFASYAGAGAGMLLTLIIGVPVSAIIFGIFGALGGFLALQVAFKGKRLQ